MMGFGDGVRPPIMTDSVAKDVMDAFDPSLHEILGADTATLLNLEEAMAREGGVDAVMTVAHPPLGPELMDQLKPKVISNCGVGVMHIDLDAASERSIPVVRASKPAAAGRAALRPDCLSHAGSDRCCVAQGNTPGVLNEATADMAMALMLACARRLPETDSFCKTGQWLRYEHMDLVGQDVSGSTVGIIGMGRIGSEIAKRAKFGARTRPRTLPCIRSPAVCSALCSLCAGFALCSLLARWTLRRIAPCSRLTS
jgi:lactate dehydrogenase-like 2-hydroxyacid dehydrogenase